MNGLLYKYFSQKFWLIILSMFVPSFFFFMLMSVAILSEGGIKDGLAMYYEEFSDSEGIGRLFPFFALTIGYFIAESIHSNLLNGDEMKKWAYFTVSSPKGVRGVVYTRYVFTLMVTGMTYIMMTVLDNANVALSAIITGEPTASLTSFIGIFFFVELFLLSIELVFNSRFGSEHGGHVKFAMFIAAVFILTLILLFVPIPNSESVIDGIFELIVKILDGDVPKWVLNVLLSFPSVAMLMYIGSYFISCKLFMKGVEGYEK